MGYRLKSLCAPIFFPPSWLQNCNERENQPLSCLESAVAQLVFILASRLCPQATKCWVIFTKLCLQINDVLLLAAARQSYKYLLFYSFSHKLLTLNTKNAARDFSTAIYSQHGHNCITITDTHPSLELQCSSSLTWSFQLKAPSVSLIVCIYSKDPLHLFFPPKHIPWEGQLL